VKLPWQRDPAASDPYWETFINRAPADPNNLVPHSFKQAKPGGVNPVKTEIHSPNVMAQHVMDLARFYGADQVGIVRLTDEQFGIVCAMDADYDPRTARGIGGQTPAMKGLFATFTVAAFIRELGYEANCVERADADQLAARAGLGPGGHAYRHVAEVIETTLPLEPTAR
jgi:hypothetical protein